MVDPYGLLLPETRERFAMEEVIDRQIESANALFRALHDFDPQITGVCFVKAESPEVVTTPKGPVMVKPGRWHVQRERPGLPDAYLPIETEAGGYREPDFGVLYELQRKDMQRGFNTPEELQRRSEKQREREQNRVPDVSEELASNIRAANRVPGDNLDKRRWGRG